MILAKVIGTVVATRKDDRLISSKLLVAQPIDPVGKAQGNHLVAVDTVDAGAAGLASPHVPRRADELLVSLFV